MKRWVRQVGLFLLCFVLSYDRYMWFRSHWERATHDEVGMRCNGMDTFWDKTDENRAV
jgi:hypothetical protein